MRFLLLSAVLVACSTDTFVGGDGGDASTNDGTPPGDAISGGEASMADAAPFDPGSLGASLVLWLDAADAKTAADAGALVASWPDHQNKYTTTLNPGVALNNCGVPGLYKSTIGSHPAISFCGANLGIADDPAFHIDTTPFFIEAVIIPTTSGTSTNGDLLFTKTQTGDSNQFPSSLTVLAPNPSNRMQGWVNTNGSAYSQNALDQQAQYVGFERTSNALYVRINSVPGNPATINASDSVNNNAEIGIGGYRFDNGNIHNLFRGQIAELFLVSDTSRIADVEFYFKKKYNL
jgi:hypothetical protein